MHDDKGDDDNGSVSDAMRLIAEYHKRKDDDERIARERRIEDLRKHAETLVVVDDTPRVIPGNNNTLTYMERLGHLEERRYKLATLYMAGASLKQLASLAGVKHTTIMNLVDKEVPRGPDVLTAKGMVSERESKRPDRMQGMTQVSFWWNKYDEVVDDLREMASPTHAARLLTSRFTWTGD